jgi:hypothetical protein
VPLPFLLWVLLAAQSPSTTAPVKPATVRGKVLAADTGSPVARAHIRLQPGSDTGLAALSAVTDGDGVYEIRNIHPGSYDTSAVKQGFLTASRRRGSDDPPTLVLREDQQASDVDFLLTRAGVISGIVLDEHDEPMAGIRIEAVVKTYQPRMSLWDRGNATTDDHGRYRIHDLAAGRYFLQAIKQPYGGRSRYPTILYPGVLRLADAQRIHLSAGEEISDVKFQMRPSPVFSISGKVVDIATGQVAKGATVGLEPEDGFSFAGAETALQRDGTFRFTEVIPGHYRVSANLRNRADDNLSKSTLRSLDVSDRDITNVVLTFGPGATIKGRVIAMGGALPAEARIDLLEHATGLFRSPQVLTEADGGYQIPNVQPGIYDIQYANSFSFDGLRPNANYFISALTVNNQDVTDTGIVVSEDATALEVAVTVDFRPGAISGSALDADDHPLPGAGVALFSADPKKRGLARYFRQGVAGTNGRFSLTGIIPGDYLIVLWRGDEPGVVTDPDVFELVEKYCVRMSVTPSGTITEDLRMSPELQRIAESVGQ